LTKLDKKIIALSTRLKQVSFLFNLIYLFNFECLYSGKQHDHFDFPFQARGGDAARGAAIAELVKYLKDFMNDSEAW
jgi:hypothetical protein